MRIQAPYHAVPTTGWPTVPPAAVGLDRVCAILRREWAVFTCAQGVHVTCPCSPFSDPALFRSPEQLTR